ncbi:MAG: esterase-like activity of phytase family protein [Cyanobacteria bacterium]|nr:esterase-like activity of phytase family protein [Cyanobacteriota bacterium]
MFRDSLIVLATVAQIGCGPKTPPAFFTNPFPLLTWLGEFTRPAGTVYPQLADSSKYGSLSGLSPDPQTRQWIGVVDDRERSRVVWLTINFGTSGLEVAPVRMQELAAGPGVDAARVTQADLEAIVALPDGRFVMAEEGHLTDAGAWQPALLVAKNDGVVTDVIDFPKEFQITGDGKRGLRDNQGFEGLAITPGGHLIAGLEQPLIEDGTVTFDRGGTGRLVEFAPSGSTFRVARQWRYQISPTPIVETFDATCSDGENGLVELLALSETHLISMERSCLMTKDKQFTANTVQLFAVELVAGDARKRLLLNFDDITFRLSSALSRLENFEALSFGPIVNGMPTLLIGSDDNFRTTQKTSFLLFGMK